MSSQPSSSFPSSLLQSLPPLSFHTIIEADHNHISSLASRFLQHLSPPNSPDSSYPNLNPNTTSDPNLRTTLSSLLSKITTCLIRHDISEDLVMRPAFTKFLSLNDEGARMASHDRQDHQELKARMLEIAKLIEIFDGSMRSKDDILTVVKDLFRDMKRHMDEESGEQLVRFRDAVRDHQIQSQAEAQKSNLSTTKERRTVLEDIEITLGKEYILTLALTPDVEIYTYTSYYQNNTNTDANTINTSNRTKCFEGGLQEYISTPRARFKDIMTKLLEDASSGEDKGYLLHKIKEELSILGLGMKGIQTKL